MKILSQDDPNGNQQIVDEIFKEVGGYTDDEELIGQWSQNRYAIMFKAGKHPTKINVGFYTQVLGLGETPKDTTVANLTSPNGSKNHATGALCNFWRGAENLEIDSSMDWAVSQAVSLRRLQVNGDLNLYATADDGEVGFASGGFMSDIRVSGVVDSGPQQQWMTRNSEMSSFKGSNWNLVFSGVKGAPASHCSNQGGSPYTTLFKTDVIAEKPYIVERDEKFFLKIPKLERDKMGATGNNWNNADEVDFEFVFVAHPNNTAEEINEKLDEGNRVVFQPGVYNLTDSIKVNKEGTVLLGIGMATLVATTGKPCIEIGDVDDVRVAGLLLEAGPVKSPVLLQWGTEKTMGDAERPGVMSDVYVRAGGPNHQKVTPTSVGTMVIINRGGTIIDNTWLWRADHDIDGAVVNGNNPSDTGIIVNGDHVTAYGLMVEHHMKHLVEWHGNYGKVVMYQSEFPYDVDTDYADGKYVSYLVGDDVTHHKAFGVGAYAFFRDHPVIVENAI